MNPPTTSAQPNGNSGTSADFPNNVMATVHIRVTVAVPPDTETRDAVVIKEGTAVSIVAEGATEGSTAGAAAIAAVGTGRSDEGARDAAARDHFVDDILVVHNATVTLGIHKHRELDF